MEVFVALSLGKEPNFLSSSIIKSLSSQKVDLNLSSQSEVNFKILNDSSKSDKDSLLIDMIALAKEMLRHVLKSLNTLCKSLKN